MPFIGFKKRAGCIYAPPALKPCAPEVDAFSNRPTDEPQHFFSEQFDATSLVVRWSKEPKACNAKILIDALCLEIVRFKKSCKAKTMKANAQRILYEKEKKASKLRSMESLVQNITKPIQQAHLACAQEQTRRLRRKTSNEATLQSTPA